MVVRHEQSDGHLHPVGEHTAHQIGAAGAPQLDGFEDRGARIHAP